MTPGPWQALLFDFDGTLAELNIDFAVMRAGLVTVLLRYGTEEAAAAGLPALETIALAGSLLAGRDPSARDAFCAEALAAIEAVELAAASRGRLFAGTRTLLRALTSRGIGVAIVTRNCSAAVRLVFPDVEQCCGAFLARDDTESVKPDPGHLRMALQRLNAPAAASAMVGDHPLDMQAGRRCGVTAVGVLTGRSRREDLFQAGAALVLPSAMHLLQWTSGRPLQAYRGISA